MNEKNSFGLDMCFGEKNNPFELFKEWYEGDGSEQDVLESMSDFMRDHPPVNAKFVRFFER